jgi:hypothetical protein
MTGRKPIYPKVEFERRGEELFEHSIRDQVVDNDAGDHVAIDIDSGDFAVDADAMLACERLLERRPDAQIWMRRVSSKTVMRIGGRLTFTPLDESRT